jgi:hypothetical protein
MPAAVRSPWYSPGEDFFAPNTLIVGKPLMAYLDARPCSAVASARPAQHDQRWSRSRIDHRTPQQRRQADAYVPTAAMFTMPLSCAAAFSYSGTRFLQWPHHLMQHTPRGGAAARAAATKRPQQHHSIYRRVVLAISARAGAGARGMNGRDVAPPHPHTYGA